MTAQLDLGPTGKISRTAGKAAVHDQKGWSFPAEFDRLEKSSGALPYSPEVLYPRLCIIDTLLIR